MVPQRRCSLSGAAFRALPEMRSVVLTDVNANSRSKALLESESEFARKSTARTFSLAERHLNMKINKMKTIFLNFQKL